MITTRPDLFSTNGYNLQNTGLSSPKVQPVPSLLNKSQQPFFIAAGLKRPHLGWFGPQAYFDMYDPATTSIAKHRKPPINMPPIGFYANNSEMCGMQNFRENKSLEYTLYVDNADVENITGGYYRLVVDDYHSTLRAAYYAVVSWMDDQLGPYS